MLDFANSTDVQPSPTRRALETFPRLTNAAKQSAPRGYQKSYVYIPCWDEECQQLYENYAAATFCEGSEATANTLIKRLDEKRQERWIETVESIDFTHSSWKAWYTMNRLTGRTASKLDKCPVSANAIASQLLQNGRFSNPDRDFLRQVGKEVAEQWKVDSKDVNMSTPFITAELVETLKSMKVGRAPGPNGVHPGSFCMQGYCGRVAGASVYLPVWRDVESPRSGAEQLSFPPEA